MNKKLLSTLFILFAFLANAQTDSTKSPITFSGFVDIYYAYDFSNPADHNRPGFIYSYNRHNEVNLNLGFIKANYQTENVRANLALMSGTYANANLAPEPGVLKNIYEANAGVKISKNKNLWVDGGVFASHIGFESAYGPSCWTLTRSMVADNTPYYESGAKISYTTDNQKWLLSGLILNGWQAIQRPVGNNSIAFGHQLTYTPTSKVLFNSSSFVGSVVPDSIKQMRYYHNFFGQFQLSNKFDLIVGFDIGAQQKAKGSANYSTWYTPVAIVRYAANDKIRVAARGEYYSDPNQVVIATGSSNGFQNIGYSLNFDYYITRNALWRIEGKGYNSKDKIYTLDNHASNVNYVVTTSLAISF